MAGASLALVVSLAVLAAGIVASRSGRAAEPSPSVAGAHSTASSIEVSPPGSALTPGSASTTTAAPTASPSWPGGVVFEGNPSNAAWSRDGEWIEIGSYDGGYAYAYVLDAGGRQVDKVRCGQFDWLDGGAYVAGSGETEPAPRRLFAGRVGSSVQQDLPAQDRVALIGRGSRVALEGDATDDKGEAFTIWTPTGTHGPFYGRPLAFSPDGSLLAVVVDPPNWSELLTGNLKSPIGSVLNVIEADSGHVVATDGAALWPGTYGSIEFSPDGRYVVYPRKPGDSAPTSIGLMSVPSGRKWSMDGPVADLPVWKDATHLVIQTNESHGSVPAGLPVDVAYESLSPSAGTTAVSVRGWVATWNLPDWNSVQIDKDGSRNTLTFSGAVESAAWSPDGTQLLVLWGLSTVPGPNYRTSRCVSLLRP